MQGKDGKRERALRFYQDWTGMIASRRNLLPGTSYSGSEEPIENAVSTQKVARSADFSEPSVLSEAQRTQGISISCTTTRNILICCH